MKVLGLAALALTKVGACMLIIVGKNATLDGSLMVAHTDDAGGIANDIRLIRVPAADWPPGTKRPVYNYFKPTPGYPRLVSDSRGPQYAPVNGQKVKTAVGYIDQVAHTYGYWDHNYGLQNDQQLTIGESTCGAKTVGWCLNHESGKGYNMFGIGELSKLVMERCDSARCAVTLMGSMAETHGFFSDDSGDMANPGYGDSAEALGIADKYGEAWMFHVLTGPNNASAVWAAQRVPDDQMVVAPNSFVIRRMNLDDPDNFLGSANLISFAEAQGWYDRSKDGEFDFTWAYGNKETDAVGPLYGGRRLWRAFDLVAPSLNLDMGLGLQPYPTYPFGVIPDHPLTPSDLKRILRDHFEGTPVDMTVGIGAGPFGNPNRFSAHLPSGEGAWERSISIFRSTYSFVSSVRPALPDEIGGVLRFGFGPAHGAVFMPIYGAQDDMPPSFRKGTQSKYDPESAWQAFCLVNNWRGLNWALISVDVNAKIAELETMAENNRVAMETAFSVAAAKPGEVYASTYQTNDNIVKAWWELAFTLISRYADGYIVFNESDTGMRSTGYPEWWLRQTEFVTFPTHYNPPQPTAAMVDLSLSLPASPSPSLSLLAFMYDPLLLAAWAGWTAVVVVLTRTHGAHTKKAGRTDDEHAQLLQGYGSNKNC